MPLSLFRSRNFSTLNALTLLLYFAISGALYYLPFGFIRVGGYSAMQAGAALSPLALIVGFRGTIGWGHCRPFEFAGFADIWTPGRRLRLYNSRIRRFQAAILDQRISSDGPDGIGDGDYGSAADIERVEGCRQS